MVVLGKDKERNQVTGVSTCAVFLTCAVICEHNINFICLIFMFCKALEQKNRCFLRIEFSFPHEVSKSDRYVLGKQGQSPESNCAFSQHCGLKLSHLSANLSVFPPVKCGSNNPYHHILEQGVMKLSKTVLAKCFELFR